MMAAISHPGEPHDRSPGGRLNALRAAVLGANDGIVSTAGLVMGVAGATSERAAILTAGVAGLVAGALSMAAGEYVSVSTQRDTERALLRKERRELAEMPDVELAELAAIYEGKGLTPELARDVAAQLTAHDALAAHAEVELQIDPQNLTSPWQAAVASAVSFLTGALLPLLVVALAPVAMRLQLTVASVVAALALTGFVSARLGGTPWRRPLLRNVIGGWLAMTVTYGIGVLVGTHV
ncbi:MAG: VIT1/CCC1 transporter family protein [Dermatophilaceae bacterium]